MLYQNAPFVFLTVCVFLVYIIYSADDSSAISDGGSSTASASEVGRPPPPKPRPPAQAAAAFKREKKNPLVVGSSKNGSERRLKTILYWNEFYGRYDTYDFGYGHEAFVEKQCAYSDCFATKDRHLLPVDQFDAIIIHIRGLPNDWPEKRSVKQRYVMLSIEAPIYLYEYRDLSSLHFNWTMTYRLDSDFPIPYAWIEPSMPLPGHPGSAKLQRYITQFGQRAARRGPNLADGKVGVAVQFVSNCHSSSRREFYVSELQKDLPVDIYGDCGQFKCPKEQGHECYKMAERKYKFYLSFEDAICKDYVTEKFFSIFGGLNLIPVVLGGANYSAIAPPHSYIDAAQFESPKALARYLKLLDSDDARFNEYFWWRDYYTRTFQHHQSLCDVCKRLHTDSGVTSSYPDMREWWVKEAGCRSGTSGLSPPPATKRTTTTADFLQDAL